MCFLIGEAQTTMRELWSWPGRNIVSGENSCRWGQINLNS